MIATGDPALHEQAWLALPWLANGRLPQAERDKIEPHVRGCAACREELAFQRLLCNTLTEPDRVTYAPGPSFRKLMDRIDGAPQQTRKPTGQPRAPATLQRVRGRRWASVHVSLWRPPGLAWAASFVLMVGFAGVFMTANRSTQPVDTHIYKTHTDAVAPAPNVLHIAFYGTVTMSEAQEALRSTGARIVDGPDSVGIFGVTPGASNNTTPHQTSQDLRVLAAHLHADPRVRWVEPIPGDDSPGDAEAPISRGP
jgi:putative zinc finger protein